MESIIEWGKFWIQCVCFGGHAGWATFLRIDAACTFISAIIYWRKFGLVKWEDTVKTIMGWAALLGGVIFLITSIFIAPYIQYKDLKDENTKFKEPSYQLKTDALILSGQLFDFSTNFTDQISSDQIFNLKQEFIDRFIQTRRISNVQRRLDGLGQQSDKLDNLISGFIHSEIVNSNSTAQTASEIEKLANNLK